MRGLILRLVAFVPDWLVLSPVLVVPQAAIALAWHDGPLNDLDNGWPMWGWLVFTVSLPRWFYVIVSASSRRGATAGKRVFEVVSAEDWHGARSLPADTPRPGGYPGQPWGANDSLVPDWQAAARERDGVHLTLWASSPRRRSEEYRRRGGRVYGAVSEDQAWRHGSTRPRRRFLLTCGRDQDTERDDGGG